MTDHDSRDTLVSVVEEGGQFIQKYPLLSVSLAVFAGYILGRFAGEEIVQAAGRSLSGSITRHIKEVVDPSGQ